MRILSDHEIEQKLRTPRPPEEVGSDGEEESWQQFVSGIMAEHRERKRNISNEGWTDKHFGKICVAVALCGLGSIVFIVGLVAVCSATAICGGG